MFRFLVFVQLSVFVASRARLPFNENVFDEFLESKEINGPNLNDEFLEGEMNDANLNPGFDIEAYRQQQLDLHNHYRSLHKVQAMTRDDELTNQAQEYAETLAAQDTGLAHCSNVPGCDPDGAGENLASASGSVSAETNATKAWYDEIWDYNFCYEIGNNGPRRPGKEGKQVGHFTQVAWNASTLLGIGYARTADRTKVYVVARYKPAGNVRSNQQLYQKNVPVPSYILNTFQNNCDGTNGAFTPWSEPSECTRSCGGGVELETRTCTNPKPSLNGADCDGVFTQLAPPKQWCNIESCPGNPNYRDQQCGDRGYPAQSATFSDPCKLYCYSGSGNLYTSAGIVDAGTHCKDDSGACVDGVCHPMPQYVAPTTPPPTNAQGQITGSYTGTPSSNIWDNIIFTVPNGATNVVITNRDYNEVQIYVGYTTSSSRGYQFGEASWMDGWVNFYGHYETTRTIAGVTFVYRRVAQYSTITIAGPVNPTAGYNFVLFAKGSSPADISWSYDA